MPPRHLATAKALDAYFTKHGWPAAGREVAQLSNGRVSSLSISRYASGLGREHVAAVGSGLYVPAEYALQAGVPMSPDVAQAMLALSPSDLLDDAAHLRLFKIARIMAAKGLADIVVSRTTRSGARRQTVRIALNGAGRQMLIARARLAKDEF